MPSGSAENSTLACDQVSARGLQSPSRYTATWGTALLLSDLGMLVVASYIAGSIVDHDWSFNAAAQRLWHSSVIFIGVWIGIFYALGLYKRSLALSFKDEFYFTTIALLSGILPLILVLTIVAPLSSLRLVGLLSAGVAVVLVGAARSTIHFLCFNGDGEFDRITQPPPIKLKISSPVARLLKRIFDIILSSAGLLIALPIMSVAALCVWVDSGRPIFFRQQRVGCQGRTFDILKFRTMKMNEDKTWARPGDIRITRVGNILRRTSIDELPQLVNVLRGQMSLVGPRPEMKDFEEEFARKVVCYERRRLALPGITGWAQVNMERNLSPDEVEEVLEHDLFYIENWSLFLDFAILLKTAIEFPFHRAV